MNEELKPIETPLPQRLADFRRRYVPVIVWSTAALACAWMLTGRAMRVEHIGLVRSTQYEISATAVGQLEVVLVDLYDRVEAGDIVAKLDETELAARIERSRALVRQLGAELDATRLRLATDNRSERSDWQNNLRRFKTDEEDRGLAALELRVTVESDEIELERLALEVQRAGPLLETGLIGQAEYENVRLLHDTVATRLEENKILLAQTESEYRTAKARREEFERGLPAVAEAEPLLDPIEQAIEVETQRLREIQARRAATVLRSPVTGQVSSILCRSGQTVVPGETILTIADGTITEILAYLNEDDGKRARENAPVLVASLTRPERTAESFVVRVGPDVELLPQRLWREPRTPEYGRAVVIAAVPGLDLTPGELLNVRFLGDR